MDDLFTREMKGKALHSTGSYKSEDFFTKEVPEPRWALVSKEVIPGTLDKNYFEQTKIIVNYLSEEVFKGQIMPATYLSAINEFADQKDDIQGLINSYEWHVAAEKLANLQINQLTRQTPAEALYDILIHFQTTGKYLLEKMYTWTTRRSPDGDLLGDLVGVGVTGSEGADVFRYGSGSEGDYLGVSFSRRV
ncbi:MAG: hypothetical protein NTW66_03345 [Candidatus Magasanikbacteria bacterium]|nr:hypothetical protein [Candidatus Magasanikbacteria bacterium]